MVDEKKLFWSASKKWHNNFDSIRKIAIGQEDDYTTGCMLAYA